FPEAVHHHARGQAGRLPGHDGAGLPHPAAGLQAQDEEPGVDQRHLRPGRGVPVRLRGRLLHRQGHDPHRRHQVEPDAEEDGGDWQHHHHDQHHQHRRRHHRNHWQRHRPV
ncbi:hypothetical protein CRUP_029406, partial [Coryphaenoides rupestris]